MGWSNSQFDGTLVIPTGATTGERIELDGTTGQIRIYDSLDNLVVVLDGDGYQLYNALGVKVAEIFLDAFSGSLDLGGYYARDFRTPEPCYAFMSGEGYQAGPFDLTKSATSGNLQYAIDPTTLLYTLQTLRTGVLSATLDHEARVQLVSQRSVNPRVWVDGGSSSDYAELIVTGDLRLGPSFTYQGRGWFDFQAITASSGGVTVTESIAYSSSTVSFRDQRAYRVSIKGYVQSNTANDTVRLRIRKNSTAGQQLYDSFTGLIVTAANVQTAYNAEIIIRNVSGATITDFLVVTYLRGSGAGTVFVGANATNPAWIRIEDIGPASQYPAVNAIT